MFAQMPAVVLISLVVLAIGGCAKQGYYPGIATLDGGKIPITKLPSIRLVLGTEITYHILIDLPIPAMIGHLVVLSHRGFANY